MRTENRRPCPLPVLALVAALVAAVVAAAPPLRAEENPTTPEPLETVVKQTRYLDIRDLRSILAMLDVRYSIQEDLGTIVLRGHPDGDLKVALELIDSLDKPPQESRSLELTAFLLAASKGEIGGELPEELTAATEQLQALFGYRGFELLDTVFLRVREGRDGTIQGGVLLGDRRASYRLSFVRALLRDQEDEAPPIVRLDNFDFQLHTPGDGEGTGEELVRLQTDVEVREGQKAVVGKSSHEGADRTLILVLEAEIEG